MVETRRARRRRQKVLRIRGEVAAGKREVEFSWNGDEVKDIAVDTGKLFIALFGLQAESDAKLVTPWKTGTLRRSIHTAVVDFVGDGDQGRAEKGQDLGGGETEPTAFFNGFRLAVGSWVNYARYVELGTSRVASRPFLRAGVISAARKSGQIMRIAKARTQ